MACQAEGRRASAVRLAKTLVVSTAVVIFAATASAQSDPGVRRDSNATGAPLPDLTAGQRLFFENGKEAFEETDFVENPPAGGSSGLGPRFNLDSCGGCHAFPAIGGASPAVNPQIAVANKSGAQNRIPAFLTQNGPVREVRFVRKPDGTPDGGVHSLFVISGRYDAEGCRAPQEDFSNTDNLSFRIPTPLFGSGLIEAIPDSTIRANLSSNASVKTPLGIAGRLNTNGNDGTVTRFGWKAQNKSLAIFAAEAYNVEQGVNNLLFPQERDETPGCVYMGSLEDSNGDGGLDDVALFSAFMRFLAPPARGSINSSVVDGSNIFNRIGCNLCHTPSLQTGPSSVAALANKSVPLYSDLALHRMGGQLADDISQGLAGGDEFRTAPLWGLGQRIFLLHDGRTSDLNFAILAHAGLAPSDGTRVQRGVGRYPASEATAVITRYNSLTTTTEKQNLLNFLRSL